MANQPLSLALGFSDMNDESPKRNPDWRAAELLLALNAYFELRRSGDKATDTHSTVVRTSQVLNALGVHPQEKRNSKFRDPAGVRRRFRYFDKLAAGEEIKGRVEYRAVWERYRDDLDQLRFDAADVENGILVAAEELGPDPYDEISRDVQTILADPQLDETEKDALVKTRKGQGRFRKELLKFWNECAISGCKNQALLVASHIKPWAKAKNRERLDPFNGLLLSPTWDRLFDTGLVAFAENGTVILSPYLSPEDRSALGIHSRIKIKFSKEHIPYIRYHRRYVFRA
ncbi:HNH endonuclease [Marinobacter sp. F4218]|uniref:HNH endonuclease n=1 Tax=Marinobacter sp. F4218 TaxID=2862868 RepID=UPI001C625791|nr:HNH endonuclease [Marinobacter sp. F4218]MBW7472313.1 HNH endonuclease [Marinobacter sp. F4218]